MELNKDSIGYEDTLTVYIWMNMDLSLASDTITPCDSSWLVKGDTRLTSEFIEYPPIRNNNLEIFEGDPLVKTLAILILAYAFVFHVLEDNCIYRKIGNGIQRIIKS